MENEMKARLFVKAWGHDAGDLFFRDGNTLRPASEEEVAGARNSIPHFRAALIALRNCSR